MILFSLELETFPQPSALSAVLICFLPQLHSKREGDELRIRFYEAQRSDITMEMWGRDWTGKAALQSPTETHGPLSLLLGNHFLRLEIFLPLLMGGPGKEQI